MPYASLLRQATANTKMNGTQEDIDAAIRQYGEDVAALNDVLSIA